MRVFLVAFFAVASLAQVHAEDRIKKSDSGCSYTLKSGDSYEVAPDDTLCWRVPEPSYRDAYTLLRCDHPPALQEIVRVKRGDPRCKKYEDRQ